MGTSIIKIDGLLTNFGELQKEKSSLSEKLQSLRQENSSLESTHDSLQEKLNHIQSVNTKMNETLKVAQKKVAATQAQVNTMKGLTDEKQKCISDITDQIQKVEKQTMEETVEFETELENLAKQFKSAAKYYDEKNLSSQIEEVTNSIGNLSSNSQTCQSEIELLRQQLDKFKFEKESKTEKANEMGIPPEQQTMVLEMFIEQNKCATRALERVGETVDKLRQEINSHKRRVEAKSIDEKIN